MDRPRDPDLAARLFGSSPERRLALVRCAWPAAVGPELARRTEVISLDGAQLRVRVPDAAWQRTLFRLRVDILARLRAIAGGAAPRSLGFVQGAVKETPRPLLLPPAPAAKPPADLVAAAAVIGDEALRAAFLASAARYLGRFASAADVASTAETGSGSAAGGRSSSAGPSKRG